jgi:DNA polymerase-3 subunit gamma/tau
MSSAPTPIAPAPAPASPSAPASAPQTGVAESATEGSLARAPQVTEVPREAPTVESLRQGVVSALANAGHESAAQLLGVANWTLDASNLRIQVAGLGKKMLSLTVNAAAEKIVKQELQRLGGPSRFMVVTGDGAAPAAPEMTVAAGSVQEEALKHPMVERAKEIFRAEVRSVVDLRAK